MLIKIDQQPEGDTGVVIWDAALVLAKYLGKWVSFLKLFYLTSI